MFHEAPMEVATAIVHRRSHRGQQNGHTGKFHCTAADGEGLQSVLEFLLSPTQLEGPGAPKMRIALQFPDELLEDASLVVQELERRLHADPRYPKLRERYQQTQKEPQAEACASPAPAAPPAAAAASSSACCRGTDGTALLSSASRAFPSGAPWTALAGASNRRDPLANPNAPTGVRFFVLADSTFGSCCPDEITAQHYSADLLVHFGEACMSRSTRLPVLYLHAPFRFHAVAANPARSDPAPARHAMTSHESSSPGSGGASTGGFPLAAVHLVVAVLTRLRQALQERLSSWSQNARGLPVCIELVVVGPHAVRALLEAAAQQWTASGQTNSKSTSEPTATAPAAADEEEVVVVWSQFLKRDAREGMGDPKGEISPPSESEWVLNGVRFPRLVFASPEEDADASGAASTCPSAISVPDGITPVTPNAPAPAPAPALATPTRRAPQRVQFFLYVGPEEGPQVVHLYGVHAYNQFHYPAAIGNAFFEAAPPVVSVLTPHFPHLSSPVPGEASVLHEQAVFAEVQTFVDRAITGAGAGGGLSQLLCTAASRAAAEQYQRRLRQRAYHLEVIRSSRAVGILVASLAIDGYYELTMLLHRLLRGNGKRPYILYVGHLNQYKLANFESTVDSFVVVACPNSRVCHFPRRDDNYIKPVLSPVEVLIALTAAEAGSMQYGLPAAFSTSFDCVLPPLRAAVQKLESAGANTLVTQRLDSAESAALVRTVTGDGTLLSNCPGAAAQGALARLHERAFVGLDPCFGQTEVQTKVEEGKHGIARGYQTEREHQPPPS